MLSRLGVPILRVDTVTPDKRGYPGNTHIFLISPQKCMLWLPIRSASERRFQRVPQRVFVEK